jgi:hypothetical protein
VLDGERAVPMLRPELRAAGAEHQRRDRALACLLPTLSL